MTMPYPPSTPLPDDDFQLDGEANESTPEFELSSPSIEPDFPTEHQQAFFLPEVDPESPPESDEQQLEFQGLEKPTFNIEVEGSEKELHFHYAHNLLESLESQGIQVPYQCREGYCGGCRTDLISGEVAYLQEPMAWVNPGEILPCCCVPKTPLKLKLKG